MFLIEKAKPDQVQEIKKLLKDTWIYTYGSYYSSEMIEEITSTWHDPKRLAEQIQDPDCYFAVAKNDTGKIVGIITAQKIKNKSLQLNRLYVHPDLQGKGIGKQLLDNSSKEFRPIKTILLDVEAMNEKAIKFYKKQGFKEYSESEETIGDTTFKVIKMKKNLS